MVFDPRLERAPRPSRATGSPTSAAPAPSAPRAQPASPALLAPAAARQGPARTPACDHIVREHERGVPAAALTASLQARAQWFDEADLACITAAGLPPAVVDYAEDHVR